MSFLDRGTLIFLYAGGSCGTHLAQADVIYNCLPSVRTGAPLIKLLHADVQRTDWNDGDCVSRNVHFS